MRFSVFDRFEYWKRAQDSIAQGALTNSKHPDSHVFGVYPTHMKGGSLGYLFGTDGVRYKDYICGLGSNLFGYSPPTLVAELGKHLTNGFSHSFPTTYEVETAERLKQMFYFVDKFKFLKSGSQACTAAIKIARAHTGRKKILSEGYHGHEDEFVSLTSPAKGVHTCVDIETYLDSIDLSDVAGVIVEPVISDGGEARFTWLRELQKRCQKAGALLIFDEVITGFRFLNHSVAMHLNLYPDLIILGKAMANGLPLAAVGGKRELMDNDYFVSSTYAGEILSLVSCKWTVDQLLNNPQAKISGLWEQGERFINRFNKMGHGRIKIEGYATRGVFKGEPLDKALFFQEACKAGFLFGPSFFYSFANKDFDFEFFTFFKDFIDRLSLGVVKLQGEMPKSPFAEKVRKNG